MTDGPRRRPRPTGRPAAKAGPRRAPAKRAPAARPARPGRRIAAGLVVSVVLVGFLLVGVFPTRTWMAQREETSERRAELERIRSEQAVQQERVRDLEDPDTVEQIAREDYGYVLPGEQAYRMLPRTVPPVDLPDTWPFTGADDWLNR